MICRLFSLLLTFHKMAFMKYLTPRKTHFPAPPPLEMFTRTSRPREASQPRETKKCVFCRILAILGQFFGKNCFFEPNINFFSKKFNFGHFWPFLPVFCPFLRILPIFDHPGGKMGVFLVVFHQFSIPHNFSSKRAMTVVKV